MSLTNRQLLTFAFAIWFVMSAMKLKSWRRYSRSERALDGALDKTFPASDPKATQDYAIASNRL